MKFWRMITRHPITSFALGGLMILMLTGMTYYRKIDKVVSMYCNTLTCASVGSFGSILIGGDIKVPTLADVTLTSPTVTFSAVDKHFIDLKADTGLTGVTPTGGVARQVLFIHGGDAQTKRFDNATSMTVGSGNVTLGAGDWLVLRCTGSAGGSTWERIGSVDN